MVDPTTPQEEDADPPDGDRRATVVRAMVRAADVLLLIASVIELRNAGSPTAMAMRLLAHVTHVAADLVPA